MAATHGLRGLAVASSQPKCAPRRKQGAAHGRPEGAAHQVPACGQASGPARRLMRALIAWAGSEIIENTWPCGKQEGRARHGQME